jgi:hypothetical protein
MAGREVHDPHSVHEHAQRCAEFVVVGEVRREGLGDGGEGGVATAARGTTDQREDFSRM